MSSLPAVLSSTMRLPAGLRTGPVGIDGGLQAGPHVCSMHKQSRVHCADCVFYRGHPSFIPVGTCSHGCAKVLNWLPAVIA